MKRFIAPLRAVWARLTAPRWIDSTKQPPQRGWIVKRWNNGSVWTGYYSGDDKMGSCDYWLSLPDTTQGEE